VDVTFFIFLSGLASVLLVVLRQNASLRTSLNNIEGMLRTISNNSGFTPVSQGFSINPISKKEEYDEFVSNIKDPRFRANIVSFL
jgi:hypothetical protein